MLLRSSAHLSTSVVASLALLVASLSACDRRPVATRQAPAATTVPVTSDEADAVAALKPGEVYQHPDGVRSIISNDGAFRVAYSSTLDREAKAPSTRPPMNDPFLLSVIILARAGAQPTGLTVDAAMPEHGHGMNVEPTVTEVRPGTYMVEEMLFHMSGRWEIYFDITRDGVTSRAQDEITLE